MPDDLRDRQMPRDTALYDYMDEDWSDRLIRALDRQIEKRKAVQQKQRPPRDDNQRE